MKFYFMLGLLFAFTDQVAKEIARKFLTSESYLEVIPNMIHLTYQENKGVSFSFLNNLPDSYRVPLLVSVSTLVIVGIAFYLYRQWKNTNRIERWGFTLVLGGAIGNLIDRAFYHSVVDFMYFHFYETGFFINNLADDYISIGFVLLLINSFLKEKEST